MSERTAEKPSSGGVGPLGPPESAAAFGGRSGARGGRTLPFSPPLEARRSVRAVIAVVAAIAATYVYFLLFAEFALFGLAGRFAATGWPLREVMGVLGAGGVAGSVLAAWAFHAARFRGALAGGFLATALAAGLAAATESGGIFVGAAGAVGLSLGWLTVTLASGLRSVVGGRRLGLACGAGTGLAYAVCNLPGVFAASAANQTGLAIGAALAGAAITPWLETRTSAAEDSEDYRWGASAAWVAVLLALVWLDSAAFYIIQHTAALKAATWLGAWRLGGNAAMHLGAALAAGWALDRGGAGRVVAGAAALLIGACWSLPGATRVAVVPLLYTAGVSLYSTALVFYPARGARPGLTALVYAVAGWGGSALGIGMAQDLAGVPGWFLAVAAIVIAVALRVRRRALAGAVAVTLAAAAGPLRAAEDAPVRLGREVYVSEGCMHCHSQYVRPGLAAEVERWGPARELAAALAERPPLLGNRRQGPDLAAVGNRRSAEWERLHLRRPRAVQPGSRMPDYEYLFRGDGARGEALVAYLGSLGGDARAARREQVARWRPTPAAKAPGAEDCGRRLFAQWCVACHGARGRGDGALAARLSVRPPDWARERWRRVAAGEPDVETALARIIKFGVPDTPMAGHEYFTDGEAVALARQVAALYNVQPRQP